MELKEFISGIIQDITTAVNETQKEYKTENQDVLQPIINPSEIDTDKGNCVHNGIKRHITYIDFDVSLIVSENDGKKGEAGIKVNILSMHGGVDHTEHSELIQRVHFNVPIALPAIETSDTRLTQADYTID